jgi:hypothetical protein
MGAGASTYDSMPEGDSNKIAADVIHQYEKDSIPEIMDNRYEMQVGIDGEKKKIVGSYLQFILKNSRKPTVDELVEQYNFLINNNLKGGRLVKKSRTRKRKTLRHEKSIKTRRRKSTR